MVGGTGIGPAIGLGGAGFTGFFAGRAGGFFLERLIVPVL